MNWPLGEQNILYNLKHTQCQENNRMQLNVQILSGSDTFHSERLQQEGMTEMLEEAAVVRPDC